MDKKRKFSYKSYPVTHVLKVQERAKKYAEPIDRLNEELLGVYDRVVLDQAEKMLREEVFQKLKSVLEREFAENSIKVEKYGSFMTDMMVGKSDIDVTVLYEQEGDLKYRTANDVLREIFKVLLKHDFCDGEIIHLKKARIPILKCTDKKYKIKIDISVNQKDGLVSGEFMKKKKEEIRDIEYMAVLLKYFMKRRCLSETHSGGLSAYAQFLLILNFLQLHPLTESSSIKQNLGAFMMDFFMYYAHIDFRRAVVNVKDGKYRKNESGFCIFIDDPICDDFSNVTPNCSQIGRIQDLFRKCYKTMAEALKSRVDRRILNDIWFKFNQKELQQRSDNVKLYKKKKNV
ncbi:PAPD7 [Enterospora canceri]|uniref:PAPD7 n=1 Tax=Enterospora canceri TaxID=1081671 RepID=A0A1Y1S5S3_9MICR|nr:PAPD7 [Enterospora canceri]